MSTVPLKGCRHDILGHYLKAIGLLRVISKCADSDHRDSDAEGWWDTDNAWFCLRSEKYPTMEALVEFFEKHYRPTPVFSPWNTGGGMDEKKEIVFSIAPSWEDYWATNKDALLAHGFPPPENGSTPKLPKKPFDLKSPEFSLPSTETILVNVTAGNGKKPKVKIHIASSDAGRQNLFAQMDAKRPVLEKGIKFTDAVIKKFVPGDSQFAFDVKDEGVLRNLGKMPGVRVDLRTKTGTKKTIMATLAAELKNHSDAVRALSLGREFFDQFQDADANQRDLLEEFRDDCPSSAAESLDAVFTTRSGARPANNPLFLNRGMGEGGNDELFRKYWEHYHAFRSGKRAALCAQSLMGPTEAAVALENEIGTPFFPDAIKGYNLGSGWVQADYPFNPLDYVLAVEGAFALRGGTARTIGAGSKRFAAFPFIFDTGEEMADEGNQVKRTASALWLPIWNRPTTFLELASFITDAQARLPGKDARFSAEFVRAVHAQGVDAGFFGWQEFRFKMKGSKVPWVTTGRQVGSSATGASRRDGQRVNATRLNLALAPLDESRFIDQFNLFRKKDGKFDKDGPHRVGAAINAAMQTAAHEPTPRHCLALLEEIFAACRLVCLSKSFREKLPGEKASFFRPLPMEDWDDLLNPLEDQAEFQREFRVARSIASITGLEKQSDDRYSAAEPALGSLLPLTRERSGWSLPMKKYQTHQDVWTGTDAASDLAAVLHRRYTDSLNDDRPALSAVHGAKIEDVIAFLRGELDDRLIARWTEAMSLIDWHFGKKSDDGTAAEPSGEEAAQNAIIEADKHLPEMTSASLQPAYAALRTLVELECEWQGKDRNQWKKRRSRQPLTALCERSISSLPFAVSEAFRYISIWGVPNPWGAAARGDKPRITGRYVVRLNQGDISYADCGAELADRLAAAVCIPVRWQLYRAVTLPPA